jgi:hypothetical protein
MKRLLALPPDKIYEALPYINKYVKNAYDTGTGEQKWETILGRAFLGDVLIWLAFYDGNIVGAASTELIDFDGYRCVHVITAGTDNHVGFEDFHYALEEHARQIGAKNLQFWGRKGWSRATDKVTGIAGEKYKEVYRVFSMEIDYERETNSEPGP